ncbi:carbohydrate-binding-like protein [Auriculariales sp. MPI-PUGE-AT-0066]|nr:carbohydrate-binding-like protein [Auriculariales sp. MPI-PUGE-AT-0066]
MAPPTSALSHQYWTNVTVLPLRNVPRRSDAGCKVTTAAALQDFQSRGWSGGVLTTSSKPSLSSSTSSDPSWGAKYVKKTSSVDNPPSHLLVEVNVTAPTASDEQIYIVGDIPELGSWDPERAIPLTARTDTYPTWATDVHLPTGAEFQYKFIRKTPEGNTVWEGQTFLNRRGQIRDPSMGCLMNVWGEIWAL